MFLILASQGNVCIILSKTKLPTANLLGFNLWGRGVATGKCTPRKNGTVLEPCWNLPGTMLEPCSPGTLLESCWNLAGMLQEPHWNWNHVGTFELLPWLRCLVVILGPKTSFGVLFVFSTELLSEGFF